MLFELPTLADDDLQARLDADAGAGGCVALCAGPRLVQHLHERHAAWQQARGALAWETPALLTAEHLLEGFDAQLRPAAFIAGAPLGLPLTGIESEALWQRVIAEARDRAPLLRESEAAALAAAAWQLCHDHAIALPLPVTSSDVERFNGWAAAYVQRCTQLGRPDACAHRAALVARLEAGEGTVPASLVLAGFDALPPWLARLLAVLAGRGTRLLRLAGPAPGRARAVRAHSSAQELRAAAAWVRARARQAPGARIGVVVPDLAARRGEVVRIFDEQLCPQFAALPGPRAARPYNLSLGEPLSRYGLVQVALVLLRLVGGSLERAAAGSLLCGPYWGSEAERLAAAELDRRLRAEGHLQVDLTVLRRLSPPGSPLQARWQRLIDLRGTRGAADPADWAERFADWLEAAGWPGARALDSAEYQVLQAWRGLLRELGRLGSVLGSVAASAALGHLQRLAAQRVFQPQSPPVPIQVLGALEAQGLVFDALWVLGLDDERWPPPGRPNPFIPFALQRRLGLPHAGAAQELAWAERSTAAWRAAAPEVVFSWAATEGDRALAPSPLIAGEAAAATAAASAAIPQHWLAAAASGALELRADAYGPAPAAALPLPGGTALVGDQARCPFRAFARHRLGAAPLEQPGYGPSAADRGQLVHRVLERLWRQWRTQAALLALDACAQTEAVAAAVETELERLATAAPQRLPAALRALESARLQALLQAWLEIERARPPFTVERIEGSAADAAERGPTPTVAFGGLQLRLRPDRIDRLADGSRLVIDYKTGRGRPPPWHDGRPEEPQLPLYALGEADVSGIAYARLRAQQIGFDGLGDDAALEAGLRSWREHPQTADAASWTALLGRWRGELETLAGELRRGLASVTPKHPRQSCRDCHLHAACRIRDGAVAVAEDEAP